METRKIETVKQPELFFFLNICVFGLVVGWERRQETVRKFYLLLGKKNLPFTLKERMRFLDLFVLIHFNIIFFFLPFPTWPCRRSFSCCSASTCNCPWSSYTFAIVKGILKRHVIISGWKWSLITDPISENVLNISHGWRFHFIYSLKMNFQ